MKDFELIESFERELANFESRENISRFEELIADDFEEFGSSGRVLGKSDILDSLKGKADKAYKLSNFRFRQLSRNYILVRYYSECGGRFAHRSSIWMKLDGDWRMIHHQATVTGDAK